MSVQLTHGGLEVGLAVQDPEPMLRFYRDFLGLPLARERKFPGVHLFWLACGDSFVKLVHLEAPPEASNPPGGLRGARGLRLITLEVANVEEVADAAGDHLLSRNDREDLTMAMLVDPEGNHVEVVRWK